MLSRLIDISMYFLFQFTSILPLTIEKRQVAPCVLFNPFLMQLVKFAIQFHFVDPQIDKVVEIIFPLPH